MKWKALSVKVGKVKATYDRLHRAWRAGVIRDFYYGRHSPSDSRLVWRVDDREWSADDPNAKSEIDAILDAGFAQAGLADAEWGERWVGYREIVLVKLDGARLVLGYGTARYAEVAA